MRLANLSGVYDTHTNMMFYPQIMQPTHARWEQIPPPSATAPSDRRQLPNGLTNGHRLPNGLSESAEHDDAMDIETIQRHDELGTTIFSDVPAIVSRNFAIIDTHYTAPPISNAGYPGPDGSILDPASGPNGLSSIPDDIANELPDDCKRALESARKTEIAWKRQWGTEADSGMRGDLKVGFNGYPV